VKMKFKQIASVLTSTVMLSSTLALAAAANYPAPFVKNGAADVAVVYGSSSANSDLVAASDINSALQFELAKQSAPASGNSGSKTTVTGGDFVKLSKPSDRINLRDSISSVYGSTLTNDDLPELLADGVYSNDENTDFDYEQRITLGNGLRLEYFQDSDYKDRVASIGVNISSSQPVLNYTLDFTNDADSDVSGGDLVDIETTTIKILGKEYYISDVKNSSLDMTLLDTANSAIVAEGETKSVTVGDKTYDVSVDSFSGSASAARVKMVVNGESSNQLSEGSTFKLKDGTYLGVKDISIRDVAGVQGKVEFSLGSGKLELKNGQNVKINDDSVNDVTSVITRGTPASSREKIDKITLMWLPQDKRFIAPDSELSLPGFGNIKLSMSSFVSPIQEVTKIGDGASDYEQITTTIKDGDVSIPILFANSSGEYIGIGKSATERLLTTNATSNVFFNYTNGDRYFVASYNTSNSAESYYLKFSNWVNDSAVNKVDVSKYESGSWKAICESRRAADTCTMGSVTLTLGALDFASTNRSVTFSGNAGTSFNQLYTKSGLKIALPFVSLEGTSGVDGYINVTSDAARNWTTQAGHGTDSFYVYLTEEDKNDLVAGGTKFNVTLNDNSDGEVEVSAIGSGRGTFTDPKDSNYVMTRVYSDLATLIELKGQSSDQRKSTVTYSGSEAYADLVLSTKSATVSSDSSSDNGTTTSGTGVKNLGNVVVSDSEVSSVSSKNLVVVGGSCVNSVAAKLLGGALCGADFMAKSDVGAGSFLVQSFTSPYANSKIAVLVAGYNAGDTTNAAKYLSTQKVDVEKVGTKYKGTSATQASMVTTAAAPAAGNNTAAK